MERTILVLLIFILNACTDNSENDDVPLNGKQFPQKWELVAMSGMIANVPPSTGDDMDWQEFYFLQADGTFTKSREQANKVIVTTGSYDILKLEDGRYLRFVYESDHELIGNCSIEPEEVLRFQSENSLIGTWWACDGPGLYYERSE